MDLVIGFSNATFNLAGACGAPVWLLTGAAAWTRLGARNYPWYPQARCFAPADYNDWSGVMAEVAEALAAELGWALLFLLPLREKVSAQPTDEGSKALSG